MIRVLVIAAAFMMVAGPAEAGPLPGIIAGAWATLGAVKIGSIAIGACLQQIVVGTVLSAFSKARRGNGPTQSRGLRTEVSLTGDNQPQSFILGRYLTAGVHVAPPLAHQVGGTPNDHLTQILDLGDFQGASLDHLLVNGERVDFTQDEHPEYGPNATGDYAGRIWLKFYDGTQTEADPMLLARYGNYPDRPWSADMRLTGKVYIIVTTRHDPDFWGPGRIPEIQVVMLGLPLYDFRRDDTMGGIGAQRWDNPQTWELTHNPVVMAYNGIRGITLPGGEVWVADADAEDFPLSEWAAAMNVCDETRDEDGVQVPRYRAGFEVKVSDTPASVIEKLLATCAADVAEDGGVWHIQAGGPRLPSYFLTDMDIPVETPDRLDPWPGLDQTINRIELTFPNPEAKWQPTTVSVGNAAYEAEDQGRRLPNALELDACPYGGQVDRVGNELLADARRFRQHTLPLAMDAAFLSPLDVISWDSDQNLYQAKLFEINTKVTDLRSYQSSVTMREVDPTDYDPASVTVPPSPPTTVTFPPPLAVPGFTLEPAILQDALGRNRRPGVLFGWSQVDADGIEYHLRTKVGQHSVSRGSVGDVTLRSHPVTEGCVPGELLQGQLRLILPGRVQWTGWLDVTVPNIGIGELDLDVPLSVRIAEADRIVAAHDALVAGFSGTIAGALATRDALIAGNAAGLTALDSDVTSLTATVSGVQNDLAMNYYLASQVDGQISTAIGSVETTLGIRIGNVENDLAINHYNIAEVDGRISSAINASQTVLQTNIDNLSSLLSANYWTTAQVNNEIQQAVSAFELQLLASSALDRSFGFINGLEDFTGSYFNAPNVAGPPQPSWSVGQDSDSKFAQISTPLTSLHSLLPRQVFTPVEGRRYRLTVELKKTGSVTSTGLPYAVLFFRTQNGDHSYKAAAGVGAFHLTNEWTEYTTEWQVDAASAAAFARGGFYIHRDRVTGSGSFLCRSIRIQDITDVTALDAAVTVTAVAAANAQSTADLANSTANLLAHRASASYVIRVTADGGVAAFQLVAWDGSSTITLNADDIVAEGTLSADRLRVGLGGNLIDDPTFSTGMEGVSMIFTGAMAGRANVEIRSPGSSWAGKTSATLAINQSDNYRNGTAEAALAYLHMPGQSILDGFPVQPEKYYEASVYVSTHRCDGRLELGWRDASGTWLGAAGPPTGLPDIQPTPEQTFNPDLWPRYVVRGKAPPTAAVAIPFVRKYGTTSGSNSHLYLHKPQVAETHADATEMVPWGPGGQTRIDFGHVVAGEFRTTNYVPGVSGLLLPKSGNIEVHNLILRGAIVDGAVSDGGEALAMHSAYRGNFDLRINVGDPVDPTQIFVFSARFDHRHPDITGAAVPLDSFMQYRVKSGSAWGAWVTIDGWRTSPDWFTRQAVHNIVEIGSDLEVRLVHVPISGVVVPRHDTRNMGITLRSMPRR